MSKQIGQCRDCIFLSREYYVRQNSSTDRKEWNQLECHRHPPARSEDMSERWPAVEGYNSCGEFGPVNAAELAALEADKQQRRDQGLRTIQEMAWALDVTQKWLRKMIKEQGLPALGVSSGKDLFNYTAVIEQIHELMKVHDPADSDGRIKR